jgi:hypothetical protein
MNNKKELAREMRLNGKTYSEIIEVVNVSKSTISLWVSDIILSKEQKDRISKVISDNSIKNNANSKHHFKKRQESKKVGYELAKSNDSFRILCSLYWGEGEKRKRFLIANCDSTLLRVVDKILRDLGYESEIIICLHDHLSEENARNFWKKELPKVW